MKYALRFIWYILRVVAVILLVFSFMIVAFFVAKDTGNVYIIVTEGMEERAGVILQNQDAAELNTYFTADYLQGDPFLATTAYDSVNVRDFTYHLSLKSIWCYPWAGTAKVVVEESIPEITVASVTTYDDDGGQSTTVPDFPAWPRGRYELQLKNIGSKWYISAVTLLEQLEPEPTATPDPGMTLSPEDALRTPAPVLTPVPAGPQTVPPAAIG